jgi:hypothetical protein
MRRLALGRPPQLDYEPDAVVQLNVPVTPALKRGIVERAERREHRIRDEVSLALASWVGQDGAMYTEHELP